ncbi:MAG: histidine phosphatase family protein, partial [Candidatus Saccharimonadales bacterium]
MKQLYFVRHGESKLNKDRLYSGQIDTLLTEEGRRQAEVMSREIKDLQIDCIATSPLQRALETTQIIARSI